MTRICCYFSGSFRLWNNHTSHSYMCSTFCQLIVYIKWNVGKTRKIQQNYSFVFPTSRTDYQKNKFFFDKKIEISFNSMIYMFSKQLVVVNISEKHHLFVCRMHYIACACVEIESNITETLLIISYHFWYDKELSFMAKFIAL